MSRKFEKKIMKNILTLCFTLLLLTGCGNEPKKEKFTYKRTETETKPVVNSTRLVLN